MRTGFEGSPEVGGKDKERRREVKGPLGPERTQRDRGPDRDDDRDPSEPKGLLEALGDLDLRAADEAIQRSIAPGEPLDFNDPNRRPGPRQSNDERVGLFGRPLAPPKDEEPPILPGDPDDLGERGRRRRTRNDGRASPVLRRGLLGV